MNPLRQFWILLKTQPQINPFILLMPLAFATPAIMPFLTRSLPLDYHPGISSAIMTPNLFFIPFIAMMWLVPESMAANAKWSSGSGFFITRAVDKMLYHRARFVFFFLLILIVPFLLFLGAFKSPDLVVSESGQNMQAEILKSVASSAVIPNKEKSYTTDIFLPKGNLLVNNYKLWISVLAGVGTLFFVAFTCRFKFRKIVVWVFYLGVIFLPLLVVANRRYDREQIEFGEQLFLCFASHQLLLWMAAIMAALWVLWWSERRFSRCEY